VYAEAAGFAEVIPARDLPVYDETATFFRFEVIREEVPVPEPHRILIYHTHTYEAYEQDPASAYRQTEKWRTADQTHNVVAVGRALAASLRALGLEVVHDETAFEPPNLDDAYDRSLAMLEARSSAGEAYDLYIDLHRDAVASSSSIRQTVTIGGEEVARFMVLVGQGTTGGYTVKPDWEANLVLANRITAGLNAQCEGLARDVKIKTGRFNQHVSDCCVLIECGMHINTLEQVLRGVPYLAQAIADALQNE
jgi:stage II sporulation protein P